ncbi:MAG: DUF4197 domain-containing protein [Candidatus Omnitrophica bacterium]|nr:DUF4197 domain-containing protein [Candidatus Omnitrophota bacterium]
MIKFIRRGMITVIIMLTVGSYQAWAGSDWFKNVLSPLTNNNTVNLKQTSLNNTTIASGLRDALRVGIDKTIALTGQTDGFFKNQAIKISMPQQLQIMDKALRAVGYGPKVDEFVLSMNRAAETASPVARDIFINSIMGITFDDAQHILNGGNTAATEYFKGKTAQQLQGLFQPVVNQKLNEFEVTRRYNILIEKYKTLPFASKFPAPSINDYVVRKALDGIFYVLGQQEQAIRQDPAARVTDILKQVFK